MTEFVVGDQRWYLCAAADAALVADLGWASEIVKVVATVGSVAAYYLKDSSPDDQTFVLEALPLQ